MLFDVLSGSAVLGDQPEGDGLANTTVLLQQDDLSLSQGARLCTCRHFLQFVAKGLPDVRLTMALRIFRLASDRDCADLADQGGSEHRVA